MRVTLNELSSAVELAAGILSLIVSLLVLGTTVCFLSEEFTMFIVLSALVEGVAVDNCCLLTSCTSSSLDGISESLVATDNIQLYYVPYEIVLWA